MSKIDFQNVHTMVGADAILEGNINLDGGLIVYGKIQGDVNTKGPVRIARTAEIVGNIIASDIHVGGTVNGNISVNDRIVLGNQSTVHGDMIYRRLYIEEGAKFSGRCDLTGD
ncbi:polymer-forming cytoskeletal protein [bacterium]|nr:polymer-forming cytoskeletal protein [bacterium]